MIRKRVTFTWEDPEAQKVFAEWCPFPDEDKTSKDADRILEFLGVDPPRRVLDVGCGNGRLSVELARRGYDVVGIDIAQHFLAEAERLAAGMRTGPQFRLQRACDIEETQAFDVVLAYWFTLGFMATDELRRTFAAFHRVLKPAGALLLVFAGARAFPGRPATVEKNWAEKGGKFMLSEKSYVDGYRTEHCIVIDTNRGEITEYTERQRGVSCAEIVGLLTGSGFGAVETYRDLDRNPATAEDFSVFSCRETAGR